MNEVNEVFINNVCYLKFRKECTVQGYTTFTIYAKSDEYCGAHPFCMSNQEIMTVLDALRNADDKLYGQIKLADNDSESFLLINVERQSVIVEGQIGICFGDNFLRFKQRLDQTVLRLLYDCFETQ